MKLHKKSPGPTTPAGQEKSKMNAVTHGLTGKTLVLCNEDQAQFERHVALYRTRFEPADQVEDDLVYELAGIRWRQRRLWSIETALFDNAMDSMAEQLEKQWEGGIDEPTRSALAFKNLADNSNSLELLRRYEAHLRRCYDRALANLEHLQSKRGKTPAESEPEQKMQNEPRPTLTLLKHDRVEHTLPRPSASEPGQPHSTKISSPQTLKHQ